MPRLGRVRRGINTALESLQVEMLKIRQSLQSETSGREEVGNFGFNVFMPYLLIIGSVAK
jgi:hypothetical protein